MKSITFHKTIAVFCFIILLSVQYYLVYNTYRLKDRQYFLAEKNKLNEQYSLSIRNDKVFPGGQKIIDSFIYRNMYPLEYDHNNDLSAFNKLRQAVCDSIFTALRARSNMDSLFKQIIAKDHLSHKLRYLLTISGISVLFTGNKYIPLFQSDNPSDAFSKHKFLRPEGIVIDGDLKNPDEQNLVTHLTVSVPTNHSYQIAFSLYIDTPNRNMIIFKRMLPILLLSIFSILLIVLLYFFTYRNWLRQKKLAEMQSDFVNSVTHEFNTPLSTIIVANKNLQNENIYNQGELILPLTEIIERQSQRLKTLFSRVLDITKLNENSLNKKEFVFADLMDEILLDYRLTSDEKNILLTFTNNLNNEKVLLDKFWFTTMLLNIFENAGKYNKNTIKKIDITVSRKETNIELMIKDNGIGMSQKTIHHIFDKFYRGNVRDMKGTSGLGLGLYYTRQCIRAHGWAIDVSSEEAVGTTFIIYLPVA